MLNLSRRQAARLFFTLMAVLVILFVLIIWLWARSMAPALAPLALAQAVGMLN